MERRALGKTGESLSILGFGGILVMNSTQAHANSLVAKAIHNGINYFDVAPTYGDAEDRLGPALQPYRNNVFLACKTSRRTAVDSEKELHNSLKKLRTDHFDLYQLHALNSIDETKQALGKGGVLETLLKAREKGLIRYLGFSAHDVPAALYAMKHFDFDTVLFPCNFILYEKGNFGPSIKKEAQSRGMGMLALKSMALTKWAEGTDDHPYPKCWYEPITDIELAHLALRFTLGEGVTALLSPGEEKFFQIALDYLSQGYTPLTDEERDFLKQEAESTTPLFSNTGVK